MNAAYFERCDKALSGCGFDPVNPFHRQGLKGILDRLYPAYAYKTLLEVAVTHLLLPARSLVRGAIGKVPVNAFDLALSDLDQQCLRVVLQRVLTMQLVGAVAQELPPNARPQVLHEVLSKVDAEVVSCCFYCGLAAHEYPPKLALLTQAWNGMAADPMSGP